LQVGGDWVTAIPALAACDINRQMKIIEQWLLYNYVGGEFTPLSKPFKSKAQAEEARSKLPERERRQVAVGVIRTKR
jgi:hypothetical protein